MGTMQAMPGTPAALENALRAQNPTNNTSISSALKYQAWLEPLGIGFDSMVVQQANGTNSPDDEFTFAQVQQMGINQTAPLYVFGVVNGTHYNVALELLRIAGMDGENAYTAIYAFRKPGSSIEDAFLALLNLPALQAQVKAYLNALKPSTF